MITLSIKIYYKTDRRHFMKIYFNLKWSTNTNCSYFKIVDWKYRILQIMLRSLKVIHNMQNIFNSSSLATGNPRTIHCLAPYILKSWKWPFVTSLNCPKIPLNFCVTRIITKSGSSFLQTKLIFKIKQELQSNTYNSFSNFSFLSLCQNVKYRLYSIAF